MTREEAAAHIEELRANVDSLQASWTIADYAYRVVKGGQA